ncbi:MAG TPA: type II secretion system protein [Opitutaceae bacterium]
MKRGFTLVEILTAMGLVGFIAAGAMGFYVQSIKNGNASEQNIELGSTMRTFMDEMIFSGSRSHELVLYRSSVAADRTAAGRLVVLNSDNEIETDDICPTGNFAVFVFYELPKPAAVDQYRISKLVGYFLEQTDTGPAALVRMTIDLSSSPSEDTVEEILADHWNSAQRRTIAPRVTPLALSDGYTEETMPQLFYRRASQNLAVCGQLMQSAARKNTKDRNTQTRTFFFNITVRS